MRAADGQGAVESGTAAPLKVLHVYRTYFPDTQGGLEEAIRQICRATASLGVENTVFTLSDRPEPAELAQPEARVVRARKAFEVASCGFATPAGVARFAREAAAHDVIHYHFPWPFADMLHLGCRVRTPAVLTYHSDVVRQAVLGAAYRPLRDRFLASMRALVATSPQYAATSEVLRAHADKVSVVPLTVDPAAYPPVEPAAVARWRATLGEPYFAFVGVLRYYKGLDFLLRAAARVPHAIAIAGQGPEGARLQREARAAGLSNVRFLGHVPDAAKVALIAGARAVVFPSHLRSEAFGVTLLEAAMLGRPMVSCRIGTGTSHVNVDGETGIEVAPADPDALAAAMSRMAVDEGFARRAGEAAKARFERCLGAGGVGRAYRVLYARCAAPA